MAQQAHDQPKGARLFALRAAPAEGEGRDDQEDVEPRIEQESMLYKPSGLDSSTSQQMEVEPVVPHRETSRFCP